MCYAKGGAIVLHNEATHEGVAENREGGSVRMRRILTVIMVVALMAAMMVAMAMPAFAFHNHPLVTGECGNKGKCTGFGFDENPGRYQNNETGDQRNEACEVHGVCIGTNNN
jgi:hypothetical protein